MAMPGYTAEASLYRTSVHYRGKHHAGRQGGGNIGRISASVQWIQSPCLQSRDPRM